MSLIPFNFNGAAIRVITDDDSAVWFVAKDIAEDLGYVWAGTLTIAHVPEQWRGVRSVLTPSGTQQMAVLTEQGLYFFLGRSDKAGALPMQMWVAGDVLPTIRATGSYQRPMTQAEITAANANQLVAVERQQREHQVALERIEQKVEGMERFHVWDHRPSNCLSLTGVKAEMNKRYGLSGAVVDYVLKDWPHLPNPAGMVRNGHEEALGSQYMVWAKTLVTTAFKRFVSECQMETATQATHPYFEGRFRLVQQAQS
jgi:prophage antirepressor-like protein